MEVSHIRITVESNFQPILVRLNWISSQSSAQSSPVQGESIRLAGTTAGITFTTRGRLGGAHSPVYYLHAWSSYPCVAQSLALADYADYVHELNRENFPQNCTALCRMMALNQIIFRIILFNHDESWWPTIV